MQKFIDREKELEYLNSEYKKKESSLIVLYGRRRIGKTSLIKEFGKDKDMIYFLATEESEQQNLMQLTTIILDNLNLQDVQFENWDSAFKFIVNVKTKNKKVIVIDEFQYLGKINSAFPSIFQRIWDNILKDENIMVILCGSLINMMESQVLNYSSPLYGRRTGQIKLKQIPFKFYNEFFEKNLSEKTLIEKYAVTGGVPKYIESFTQGSNIYNEIEKNILNNQSYLYEEPYFLLQNEVSEVGSYFSIIKTIAAGNKKMGNIASKLNVSPTNLSKYLLTLCNLDILEREVPITEENPEKSKKGRYSIKDNYIAFWFQFIYPNKAFLEMGNTQVVMEKIKNHFHLYIYLKDNTKIKTLNILNDKNISEIMVNGPDEVYVEIDGKIVNIDYVIQNGDRIEIITSQNSKGPSRDWLNVVKSTQARNKINQWFRTEYKEDNIFLLF